jgi:hypothetical protein
MSIQIDAGRKQRIKSFLPLRVRLSTDVFTVGSAETEQRFNQFPPLSNIPYVEGDEHNEIASKKLG